LLAVVALGLGSTLAWFVVTQLFEFDWLPDWIQVLTVLGIGLILVLAFAIGVPALDATTGSSWLTRIAQGLALVLVLYNAVKILVPNQGLRRIVNLVILPSALLMVFDKFDDFSLLLDSLALELGNIRLSALFIIKSAIFGAILFWLGRQSNNAGQTAIRNQADLDLGMQELLSKLFQILLFIIIGIVFLQVLGKTGNRVC